VIYLTELLGNKPR